MHIKFTRLDHFKVQILFSCFTLIVGQRCSHNQFRCNTGECLRTEVLCNGKPDCPNGEDEPRGSTWNCGWKTLAKDNCDPATQFRCRFGGCINRSKVCDGAVDCFGGGDESFDVCEQGNPPAVQITRTRPPRPVTRRPRPPPTQPRTRPPASVQTTSRSQFPSSSNRNECSPLVEDPSQGFEIQCTKSGYPLDCERNSSPEGTIALYSCDNMLFTAISSVLSSASRKCENGRWSPLNAKFGCEPKCGESSNEIGAFIVGGSTSEAGKWPWMVAIYERNPKNNKMEPICGASLISQRAVVTAAHCVVRRDSGAQKSNSDLKLLVGKYYRSYDKNMNGVQESDISDIFVNPDYNKVSLYNDIAIIKLSKSVQISNTVRPICLPDRSDYREIGQYGTLIGWGRGDRKVFKEELQQVQLPVVSQTACIDAHPQFAYLVHKGTFCAGYLNGTSACDGDSGGPLVFRDRYNRHKWVLHGVVSAGIAASGGGGRGCNPNYYTVFTDVGFPDIRLWIDRILSTYFA